MRHNECQKTVLLSQWIVSIFKEKMNKLKSNQSRKTT